MDFDIPNSNSKFGEIVLKNSDSAVATYRVLLPDYDRHNQTVI